MEDLRVERNRTTVDLVLGRLREAIVSGRFAPGQHLRETELAQDLGVSRTPVREALRRLENEKLVVNLPYRGVVVKELSEHEGRSVYQVRAVLEGLVARLATENRTPEMLQAMEESLSDAEKALMSDDRTGLTEATQRFHNILYQGSGNAYLTQLLQEMRSHIALLRLASWSVKGRPRNTLEDHRRIYLAIASGDAGAAEAAAVLHITLAWYAAKAATTTTSEAAQK